MTQPTQGDGTAIVGSHVIQTDSERERERGRGGDSNSRRSRDTN